jgi:hypothetical protein
MSEKEYEMDDHYKKAAAFLVEQIAERDEFAENLKLLPPEARPEGLRLLAEFDNAIERGEQALAKEYETYQNMRRLEDKRDQKYDELTEALAGSYIHVKYRHPEMLAKLEEAVDNMDPDQAKAFRESAARQEKSGDLVKIIRREGETREQAEEFLKNYRAAEGK